jgi:TRAP-type C4-dicarboxylate transport system permease small subunit
MRLIRAALEKLAFAILVIGGIGMLMSMFLGVADVVGTQGFGNPVPGAKEVTESTMVLIVFGALTYAQIRRSHIRVELLYTQMPPRVRSAMDFIAHAFALLFFALMCWQAYNEAIFSMDIDESTDGLIRFPLWPARIVLAAGCGLVCLQLLLDMIDDVRRVRSGEDPPGTGEGQATLHDRMT